MGEGGEKQLFFHFMLQIHTDYESTDLGYQN